MCQQLDIKSEELDRLKDEHKETVALFQNQLKEARRLIEDLESDKALSVAAMKQEFHDTLESKDSELMQLKHRLHDVESDNIGLKEEIKNLIQKSKEEAQSSYDVIANLKAEKNLLDEEARKKIEISEQQLELEKDSELQELRRGKVEALHVLQQQMQDRIKQLEEEKQVALEERDQEWEEKLLQRDQVKRKEFEAILAERQEEMMLAIEEQQLQKIAAVGQCDLVLFDLKTQCEALTQDKRELEIRLENFQIESSSRVKSLEGDVQKAGDSGDHRLEEVKLSHDRELALVRESCKTEYNKKIEDLQAEYTLKVKDLTSCYEQRLTESQVVTDPKSQNDAFINDSQITVTYLQNEVQALDKEKSELKMKISELEMQICAEKENCKSYLKQLEELDSRARGDRDSFQIRLKGLIERIDHQSNSMDSLIEENKTLHTELASIQAKSNEAIATMRQEMETLCQTAAKKIIDTNRASLDNEAIVSNTELVKNMSFQSDDKHEFQALVLEELGVDQLRAQIRKLKEEALSVNELHIQQIASSVDTIKSLELRISDLIDRENHLNVELEQSKLENERNLALHNSDMQSLRSKIDELRSSEHFLKEQVQRTNEHCEAELARASMDNVSALSQFSELLTDSQKEMSNIIQDLMETKEHSNEIVASLEQELQVKCLELEKAYQCITELGGDINIYMGQSNGMQDLPIEQPTVNETPLKSVIGEHEIHFDTQNFNECITSDSEMSNFESGDGDVCQKKSVTELQNRQEMPPLIADDLLSTRELLPEDLLQRITELENSLAEKDQKIFWFESKVKEFGNQIQRETREMRMRSQQVELLIADKDELLKEKADVVKNQVHLIKDLEKKLHEHESVIAKKTSDFDELQSKFWQLQSEAKSKIMSLKKRLVEEGGGNADVSERIKQLQEDFAAEVAEMQLVHETEVKILKESLAKEQQSMIFFKENVKKQFEESQEKVKFMIDKLKDGCEQSLKDRDHLYQIKLMNLEREKNIEKDRAVQDLNAIIEKLRNDQQMPHDEVILVQSEEISFLKAELESLRVRHHETLLCFKSEKDAILKHASIGNEHLSENIKELEQDGANLSSFDSNAPGKSDNDTRFVLKAEFEKLSAENHSLYQRITDLEKQRDAIMEMARDIRIDQGDDIALGTMARNALNELEGKVDSLEQREELKRLQSEVMTMMEKITLQEQREKEVVERFEAEKKGTEVQHASALDELKRQCELKDADVTKLNRQISQANDIIKHLNEKTLNLEELVIQSRENLKKVVSLIDLNEQNEINFTRLRDNILDLEEELREKQNKWNKKECSFSEHTKPSLNGQFDTQIDDVTMLNASIADSEEATAVKTFNELNATTLEELHGKEKKLDKETNTEESFGKCVLYEAEHVGVGNLSLDSHKLSSMKKNLYLDQIVEQWQREDGFTSDANIYKSDLEKTQQQLKVAGEKLKKFENESNSYDQNVHSASLSAEAIIKRYEEILLTIKQEHTFELEKLTLEWQTKLDVLQVQTEEQNFHKSDNCGNIEGISVERVEKKVHKVVLPVEILPATTNASVSENNKSTIWELHEQEMEQLRVEHKSTIQHLENEHNVKVIQLIKDFNVQMVEREQQIKDNFQKEIESLKKTEARLLSDHCEQTRELHQQITDLNARMEEIVQNCEAQLQVADERHKDHIGRLNQIIQDLQQTLVDKEHEWTMNREAVQPKELQALQKRNPLCPAALESSSKASTIQEISPAAPMSLADADLLRKKVVELELELQELKQKHSKEVCQLTHRLERYELCPLSPLIPGIDHKASLVALGGDDVFQLLELQNSNLEAEVNRHLTEIARLRERERKLLHELEVKCSFSHSETVSASAVLGSLLMEPTEMEYLKNVLYNYMIGLETKTLAKVICTVVKFSDDQTRLILEKEETKSSIFGATHR